MQISSLLFKSTQMKKKFITINKIAGKIQYLTEVLPQIETNTILCKTLTGLGATYSEIKAKRHSIISGLTDRQGISERSSDNNMGREL